LQDLIYGWGNEMWSALDEYLIACIQSALVTKGPILECGSGLTTVLVGAIAQQRGLNMWSLEHEVEWAARVRTILNRYQVDRVVVCEQPITDYGEYCWYRVPVESMPDSFDLVICDGPPAVTKGGRYGLAPRFEGRFKPGCVILLDDAWRQEEQQIAERWESELGASSNLRGSTKPFIELRVAESLR
jgi:predicted O-methyltransferase YrrM